MSITRTILNKIDEKMEKIDSNDEKHPYLKSFGLGVIEGAIDNTVFMYPIVLASAIYWKSKSNK